MDIKEQQKKRRDRISKMLDFWLNENQKMLTTDQAIEMAKLEVLDMIDSNLCDIAHSLSIMEDK